MGLLVGFLLGVVLLVVLTGNPFSSSNEITYQQVRVIATTEDGDGICVTSDLASTAPATGSQECAVLGLAAGVEAPAEGDVVMAGLARVSPPEGDAYLQIVWVEGTEVEPPTETESATEPATESG